MIIFTSEAMSQRSSFASPPEADYFLISPIQLEFLLPMATEVFDRFMELPIELKLQIIEKMHPVAYARFHQTCHYAYDFCEKYHYRLQCINPFLALPSAIKIRIIRKLRSRPFARLRQTCQFMDEFYDRHREEFGIMAYHKERTFGLQNSSRTILYNFHIVKNPHPTFRFMGVVCHVRPMSRVNILHINSPELGATITGKGTGNKDGLINMILDFIESQRKVLSPRNVLYRFLDESIDEEEMAERSYNALISEIKENSFGGFVVIPTSRAPYI